LNALNLISLRAKGLMATLTLASTASSDTPPLKPALAPLGFLVGSLGAGTGKVAETGGTGSISSTFTVEAKSGALLRRDHTDLFDAKGRPTGGFDQIIVTEAEGPDLCADHSDGEHVIHHARAVPPVVPRFRLAYNVNTATDLAVTFEMQPPGQATFRPIAVGDLHRVK
jgi:hypothetical protein